MRLPAGAGADIIPPDGRHEDEGAGMCVLLQQFSQQMLHLNVFVCQLPGKSKSNGHRAS